MAIPQTAVGMATSHEVRVDRSQLLLFAKATGGTTPEQVDVDAARAAGHPDLLVPPTFLFGLDLMQPDPFGWLDRLGIDLRTILHGTQSFEFHAPAHAGDVLQVRSVITGVGEKKGGLLELIDRETAITRGDDAIATLKQTIVVRHREKAA